jgi:hypothetical protein
VTGNYIMAVIEVWGSVSGVAEDSSLLGCYCVVGVHNSRCTSKQREGHEGVWGSGRIAPRVLNLGTRCRWVVSFTPQPLYLPVPTT